MTDHQYLWGKRSEIRLRCYANRLYQQERQRIFELREGLVKVSSLVAGSVALARVAEPVFVNWSVAIIFLGTSAALVFGWGGKARDAAKRSTEWARLERDIEAAGERSFTEAQLAEWAGRCNDIEAGEPSLHPGLWERCYLRACQSLGHTAPPGSVWARLRPAIFIH